MSTPGRPCPSVAADPGDIESCPRCGGTSGVKTITDTEPGVWAWSCGECGEQWWITIVNPHARRALLDHLAVEVTARAVLHEITTLADQVDTLTDGQLRARLLDCWGRLAQAGHHGCHRYRDHMMNETIQPPDQRWLDADGTPTPVGAVVEQTGIDTELGALRSRHGKQGQVLRRSATRLVVRFNGEPGWPASNPTCCGWW